MTNIWPILNTKRFPSFFRLSAKAGTCYKLKDFARSTIYKLHVLMYLGIDFNYIREKRLELLLINDKIGRETFPIPKDMVVDNASVVFRTKSEFDRFMIAHYIYEKYMVTTELNEMCAIISNVFDRYKAIHEEEMRCYNTLPQWLRKFTSAHLYLKILEKGIKKLKESKSMGLAIEILNVLIAQDMFRQHKKAEWYAEKALILQKLVKHDEAAQVLLEGFKSDLSEDDKDSMRQRALIIANQKSATINQQLREELSAHGTKDSLLEKNLKSRHMHKQPMENRNTKGSKLKFMTRTKEGTIVQDVEEYCISQYISNGDFTNGCHCEGKIITTIFFLLFWDIIYTKPNGVRGIFLSYFQQFPLDMFFDDFYKNRKAAIDKRLSLIENFTSEKLVKFMEETWRSRPESEVSEVRRGVSWEAVSAAGSLLSPRALAALCRRLARRPAARSGFPDLTLWHTGTRAIRFVEVKTDSDKPSLKQLQWMHYLQENGIDTEICYVGINTTKQKARAKCRTSEDNFIIEID